MNDGLTIVMHGREVLMLVWTMRLEVVRDFDGVIPCRLLWTICLSWPLPDDMFDCWIFLHHIDSHTSS